MNNKQIKSLALIKLKGNWGNCLAINFAVTALGLLIYLGQSVTVKSYALLGQSDILFKHFRDYPLLVCYTILKNLLYLLLLSMIHYIIVRQFIDISRRRNISDSRNALYRKFGHFVKISFVPQLCKALILISGIIPGFFGLHSARNFINYSTENSLTFFVLLFFMLSVLMIIISVIITFYSLLSLHLLPVVLMLNPAMSVKTAIGLCYRITDGQRLRMLSLYISFIKFLPLCLLVYPIFAIAPYFIMSDLVLIDDIMDSMDSILKEDKFFSVFPPVNEEA